MEGSRNVLCECSLNALAEGSLNIPFERSWNVSQEHSENISLERSKNPDIFLALGTFREGIVLWGTATQQQTCFLAWGSDHVYYMFLGSLNSL